MSNLVETDFFEYWSVNADNEVVRDTTNPKIIKQTTEYDKIGRAVKSCQSDATAVNSDKRCIETEHDIFGNIVKKEEAVYDQNNQKRNDVHGETREITYDHRNRPVETVNYERINSNWVETSSSENSYDSVTGRLFRTETTRNTQTITEDYGFDTFGRVTSVQTTDPANSSRYRVKFYNTGGQVIWEADEESDGTSYSYTDLDILNIEVGNQKYYTYNAFGDLEKTVYVMTNNGKGFGSPDLNPWLNDSQITTNFTYDIFGRIKKRINDRSGVTEYNYYTNNTTGSHSRNKLQSIQIFPAPYDGDTNYSDLGSVAQTYTYTYNDKGDESSVEYTEGNSYSMEVAFTRDAYGRITGKTSNGDNRVTQTFTYNSRNLLETATDTVGNAAATSVTRLYDSFGNPYSEAVSANNITKTVSRRMSDPKTYQFTYPDGKIVRKTATGKDLDSIEYNNAEIASYSRANGVLTAVTKGQNLIETFSYNNWNMLDNHTVSNANADIYDMSYNYSRGWHLIEKADGIKNTSDKYTYDSYYRLKEVKYDFVNNTAARTDNFYQDGVHNIEQSTENGTTFAWGVDKLNRLRDKKVGGNTAVTYKYDKRNNMISEDRSGTSNDKTYIYDDLNRLIEVKDGSNQTIAEYTYDAFNRRITKTVGNKTERYTYDDWNIVEIATNSNLYTNIIDSGTDRHIAIEVTANNISTLYYFLTDERGNVTALTDESGNILERYRYRVYGDFEILDSQFTPKNCNNQTCYATNLHNFLWGGSLYEPETNLYWMRNRYYHIDIHRFINQDPIGIWGDANNLGNGFAYVAGMVIEASDPTGLKISYLNAYDVAKNQNPYYPLKECSEKQMDQILADVNSNSVAAEQWDKAESSKKTVYIGCNSDDTSYTISYGKDFRINLGKDVSSWAEGLAHELYHFNKHGELLKRYDELKQKYEQGTATDAEKDELIALIKKLEEGEKEAVKKQEEAKAEEDEKKKKGGEQYPGDPDSSEDKSQSYFANQFIKKILEMHEKKSFFEMMEEEGPVIRYEDNGRKVFIFNPFYRGKDPMKQTYWKTKNADGTNGFVMNPFAPGAEYGYDSTTYEKWQNKGFIQTNVDPYFN